MNQRLNRIRTSTNDLIEAVSRVMLEGNSDTDHKALQAFNAAVVKAYRKLESQLDRSEYKPAEVQ